MNRYILPTAVLFLIGLVVSAYQPNGMDSAGAQTQKIQSAADGIWLGVGPNMETLPLGTYRFLFIPSDPSREVNVTTVTTGVGTPTPPPIGDLPTKVAESLKKVTDPDKKKTASNLVTVYEEFVKSADSGGITNAGQLATAIQMLTTITTSGKPGWADFAALVTDTLSKSPSVAASAAVLKTVVAELRKVI